MSPDGEIVNDSLHLHDRLLAGDPTATAQLAELCLPPLVEYLRRRFRYVDDDLIQTAAEDALIDYYMHPDRYDPSKLTLHRYLRMSARGDLYNALRRQKAKSDSSRFGKVVELDRLNVEQEIKDVSLPSIDEFILHNNSPFWERVREILPDPLDQEILLFMMENVRDTGEYAEILGIANMPPDEQMREVKRHKDRVKKRLQRHLDRSELVEHE